MRPKYPSVPATDYLGLKNRGASASVVVLDLRCKRGNHRATRTVESRKELETKR